MPRVARKLLKKEKMDRFYNDFWTAVALLETKREARSFFFDLLTHTERKMLAKRLQVAMMLVAGCDYQTIRKEVEVANSTIARINNWLKTGADGLIEVAKRLIDWESDSKSAGGKQGRYLAGDLLMPAVEVGAELISRQIKKRRKKKLARR